MQAFLFNDCLCLFLNFRFHRYYFFFKALLVQFLYGALVINFLWLRSHKLIGSGLHFLIPMIIVYIFENLLNKWIRFNLVTSGWAYSKLDNILLCSFAIGDLIKWIGFLSASLIAKYI